MAAEPPNGQKHMCVKKRPAQRSGRRKRRRPTPADTREGHVTSRCIKPRQLTSLSSTARPEPYGSETRVEKERKEQNVPPQIYLPPRCDVSPALPHRGRAAAKGCGGLHIQQGRQYPRMRPHKTIARMEEDRIDGVVTIYSDAVAPPIEGIFNDPCHACA